VERTPSIAPGAAWSKAAARAAVALSRDNVPVDRIRKAFGVGWNTVMRAVVAAAELVPAVRPTRVGIDETVMTTGRLIRRRRRFLTALVCLDSGLVVDVVTGRDRASAVRLLTVHAPDVQVIACDLFWLFGSSRGYRVDRGELGPVGTAGVEQDADAPVGPVRDPERDAFDALGEIVDRLDGAVARA